MAALQNIIFRGRHGKLGRVSYIFGFCLSACLCPRDGFKLHLEEEHTRKFLVEMTAIPHPFGSTAQEKLVRTLAEVFRKASIEIYMQEFSARTPNPVSLMPGPSVLADVISKNGFNLLLRFPGKKNCAVALGSHSDTKIISEPGGYLGANDSGSSTAGLASLAVSLAKSLNHNDLVLRGCSLYIWFFDGEEAQLDGWDDGLRRHPAKLQDNTYGSRQLAESLRSLSGGWSLPREFFKVEEEIQAVLVLDMIGSKNPIISRDSFSDTQLLNLAEKNLRAVKIPMAEFSSAIADDHLPFLAKKIPSVDIIDFNNLGVWHKLADTQEKIDLNSIHAIVTASFNVFLENF